MIALWSGVGSQTSRTALPVSYTHLVTKQELDTPYSRRMVYLAYVLNRYLPPAVEKFKDYTIQRTKTKK